jgi:hypothetical protein
MLGRVILEKQLDHENGSKYFRKAMEFAKKPER